MSNGTDRKLLEFLLICRTTFCCPCCL